MPDFQSLNCRKELEAALASQRPIILLHEQDDRKGGESLDKLKADCRTHCSDETCRQLFSPSVLKISFDQRLSEDFQLVTLRMLVAALYTGLSPRRAVVHAKELSVPSHPQLARTFSSPVHMQVCASNSGALDVANLILAATRQCQPHLSFKVVETHSGVLQTRTMHLLVYLNGQAHTKYYPLHASHFCLVCSLLTAANASLAVLQRRWLDSRSRSPSA